MKILFTIPHFFDPQGSGNHGSVMRDPRPRIQALTALLLAIHQLFGRRQVLFDFPKRRAVPANQQQSHEIDVFICTTRGRHVLNEMSPLKHLFQHLSTNPTDPMLLGFECHALQRELLGKYDYYCFMEDDIVLHDPWLFAKLSWFGKLGGNNALLQPYRFEVSPFGPVRRAYLGGPLPTEVTSRYQNVRDHPEICASFLDRIVTFHRAANPHSGCYFLNADQMRHWAERPYFLDRDTSFIGPLESAASMGVMRAFQIYKPAREHASFFEVQHFGSGYLSLIGNQISLEPEEVLEAH